MGVDICVWRCKIGCFTQPVKHKSRLKTLKLKYISLSIRIALFYLLVAQCVESNPGPKSQSQSQPQTRSYRDRNSDRNSLPGSSSGAIRDTTQKTTYIGRNTNISNRQSRRDERIQSVQTSLNEWVGQQRTPAHSHTQPRPLHTDGAADTSANSVCSAFGEQSVEPDIDLKRILLDIQHRVSRMDTRMDTNFDELQRSISDIRSENRVLREQNEELVNNVESLKSDVQRLEKKLDSSEQKRENMESQSRRNNLKFFGIKEEVNESWDATEQKVRNYVSNDLNVPSENIKIERAHRLPGRRNGEPRSIIVKFSFFKEKETVLKAYRDKRKSRENNQNADAVTDHVRVSEDYPERISKSRSLLYPFMMESINIGKRAFLRYDKLIIDGIAHVYDNASQRPVPVDL